MLKKRLIGVITVRQGIAVQSFGYKKWLPLGSPEALAKNLDRWGVDEILISCIDRTSCELGPDFNLLEKIGRIGLSTPLIYGGGISNGEEVLGLIKAGADRVVLDSMLFNGFSELIKLSKIVGAQALIAALPLSIERDKVKWLNHKTKELHNPNDVLPIINYVSEILIIDWKNEGGFSSFDENLIHNFPIKNIPLILFGGLTSSIQYSRLLSYAGISGIAIGNSLNYSEHKVQELRSKVSAGVFRPPRFQSIHEYD
jgi:cyclase